ncbi:MAG: NAD-dependent epimerase/dehydratase family protein [Acidimicrobiales bacterium]|nr:NAD-dependent epimerase/dehydratase family protein [Acidimicrobiales bacterium]
MGEDVTTGRVASRRVLVTGGSGFIGAHSARALVDAGHPVRFLVRDRGRLERTAGALGVPLDDVVLGDVGDAPAVRRALHGCDAVLHAAAVVGTGADGAEAMTATNEHGARTVLGAAVEMGLDPIVHVSSGSVLYPTDEPVVGPDSPLVEGLGPYAASKVAAERFARELQEAGAPVVCTYPMMVLGPPAGERAGESAGALPIFLRSRVVTDVGYWSTVDVRDVASVHVAAMRPGLGPRRYTCGGHFLATGEAVTLMERATGRAMWRVPVPVSALVAMGGLSERLSRVVRSATTFTRDAMVYLTRAVPVDDTRTVDELGVTFRDPFETIRDTIQGLVASGTITPAHAGKAAP